MLRSDRVRWATVVVLLGWAAPAAGEAEIQLTPKQAVQLALQHNLGLQLERLDPALTDAAERVAQAAFSPRLVGQTGIAGEPGSVSPDRVGLSPSTTLVQGEVGVVEPLRYGTTLEAALSSSVLLGGGGRSGLDPAYEGGLTLSARQPLLQGRSRAINETPLLSARLTREAAQAALGRQAELVAAETVKAYWDLRAALAKVKIQTLALETSELTLTETEALIGAGKLAESERASANYAVQQARRAKAQVEQELADQRDRLARLIGLVSPDSMATPLIVPVSNPRRTPPTWVLEELHRQARGLRGDYRVLQLENQLQTLQAHVAQHQLLPRLDLVAGLGLSGLSGTATGAAVPESNGESYWSSYAMDKLGWSAGLVLEIPLSNAAAQAELEIAELRVKRAAAQESLATQELSLQLNLAWRAVASAREQLRLTEEAGRLAEAKLANETANYKAGKITAHILSTVQADAVAEQLGREQALATLAKALVDLRASSGILLTYLKLRPDGTVIP